MVYACDYWDFDPDDLILTESFFMMLEATDKTPQQPENNAINVDNQQNQQQQNNNGNAQQQNANQQNQQSSGGTGLIQGALKAIQSIISNFVNFIGSFFTGSNKGKMDQIEQGVKQNPALGNKRVQYDDCTESNAAARKHLQRVNACMTPEDVDREIAAYLDLEKGQKHSKIQSVIKLIPLVKLIGGVAVTGAGMIGDKMKAEDKKDPELSALIDESKGIISQSLSEVNRKAGKDYDKGVKAAEKKAREAERVLKKQIAFSKAAKNKLFLNIYTAVCGNGQTKEEIQNKAEANAEIAQNALKKAGDKQDLSRVNNDEFNKRSRELNAKVKSLSEDIKRLEKNKLFGSASKSINHRKIRDLEFEKAEAMKELQELGKKSAATAARRTARRTGTLRKAADAIQK